MIGSRILQKMKKLQKNILDKTEKFVQEKLSIDSTGHDFLHVVRVRRMACAIAKTENVHDTFVIEMASLLHDMADYKLNDGDDKKGMDELRSYLLTLSLDNHSFDHIVAIVENMSFRKTFDNKSAFSSIEMEIVQDADRLDAIGAVGIARCFSYGGARGNVLYDPCEKAQDYTSSDEYKKTKSTSINHFYEKLLKLKGMMNTKTGRRIAEHRHRFMESFLKEFFDELDGKR